MDDEFLYAYREEPREAFRRELYERLAHLPVRARRRARRWLYRGLAVLVLGMVLFLGFSPAARAQIMFIIHQIGGLVYVQTTEVPSYGLTPVSFDFGRIEEPAEVPLEEARSLVLFDFMVPTWAPRGYRLLEDKVHVHGVDRVAKVPTDWALVELRWLNDRADIIQLFIRPPAVAELGASDPIEMVETGKWVKIGALEEVRVRGKPAALVRGTWGAMGPPYSDRVTSAGWDHSSVSLTWFSDGLVYMILANPEAVTAEDLLRMAESMR